MTRRQADEWVFRAAFVIAIIALIGSALLAADEPRPLVLFGNGPAAAAKAEAGPVLTVFGRAPAEVAAAESRLPTVFVYVDVVPDPEADDYKTNCANCKRLWKNEKAGLLPFALEWKLRPAWAKAEPTLHWRGADGCWKSQTGYIGPEQFVAAFRATQAPVTVKAAGGKETNG